MMNSFSFFSSGKLFIFPLILWFAGRCSIHSLLHSFSLFPLPSPSWQSPSNYFSLAAFKILSLSLTFGLLIMMYLGVGLFSYILLWAFLFFLNLHVYFLHQIREVFFHYFFQIDFQFLALSLLHLVPL